LINNFLKKFIHLNRINKKVIMIAIDSALVMIILLTSFSLRFSYFYWPESEMNWVIFGSPLIAIPVFFTFKMYHSVIRYIGTKALNSIFQAVTLYSVLWGLVDEMFSLQVIPRSVIFINWMLCLILITGSRVIARWVFSDLGGTNLNQRNNIIIYGAGRAGIELSRSLNSTGDYSHIAYLDDNEKLSDSLINGVYVFDPSQVELLVKKYQVDNIFIALPSISRKNRNKIIEKLSPLPVKIQTIPSMSELAEGKIKIDDLREINIKDLLGRKSVEPNNKLLKTKIYSKVVLVTGAGGSIGSELSRQIIKYKPKHLILFEISESALYQIQQEISTKISPNIEISAVLGSVKDYKRMIGVFNYFKVHTVYHAAAYKHVPLVEYNQSEGVLNNSIGTMLATRAAIKSNVETFVLISTDKAVRPTNTMGATKRVAELILQALSKMNHNTSLTMVRFGNVLDSSGSVIPLFRKQIKEGGPITITDKNMVRYFMTIPEAVELVIQAGAMGKGGDVFVLDMGEPVKIFDLAEKMVSLSGLQLIDDAHPDGDIDIKYTGLRPGEKLYEELLVGNNVSKTENKLIFRAEEEMIEWELLEPILKKLEKAASNSEDANIRSLLMRIVPEFKPNFPLEK
jgi:FlaA1/EpsC-like NDP-sugar epimerase